MAKASQSEIDNAIELAQLLQSTADVRNFESPRWPDTDESEGEYFEVDDEDDLREFYNRVKKLCPGLMRVAMGYQVLIDNACDPDAGTLEWKPGIVVPES